MPRHPDPELEGHILKAARSLWKRGGTRSLTLRAVAKAAGSNTPAVYRRFKNRQEIVRALLRQFQVELGQRLQPCCSIEEMLETYLDWALSNRHEFDLFQQHAQALASRDGSGHGRPLRESRPNLALLEDRLAQRLGGSPADHARLALALWAATHGTITLILNKAVPHGHEKELLSALRTAVQALLARANEEFAQK